MLRHLKQDLPASLVVFLVALPLCLGVALASGAPLISGIVSGIIGGIVVGFLSGSHTSVSGPAAGLTTIVLAAITKLGSFEVFLTAVFLAGCLQLLMGFGKMGFIADYIPSNVIKGLLAAIGLILITKQIPHAIGYDKDPEDDFSFFQPDGQNTFSELLNALDFFMPGALIISLISVAVLLIWDKTPLKQIGYLPSSLAVVVLGVALNEVFKRYFPMLEVQETHLVNLPSMKELSADNFFHFPLLQSLSQVNTWLVALSIAAVASLETLLNIEAVDKIDLEKRRTPPNQELIAQGAGNILAGFLGAIPLTSVIVRSSVNIQAGGRSKLSAILHGCLMLTSIFLLSEIINLIPLSALAAILIITGYKLTRIDIFKDMYKKGWEQFIPFVATVLAIVFTDLIVGVLIGLVVSIFFLLRSNFLHPYIKEESKLHIGDVIRLELPNQVSFLNKAALKDTLWAMKDVKLTIDARETHFIDHDVLEIIEEFKTVVAPNKNISLNIIGLKNQYKQNDYIQFSTVLDKKTREKLNPKQILGLLKEGNERFLEGREIDKYFHRQVKTTAVGQSPMAVIVNCIDSRTSPELIFDAGLGDFLTIRVAGNIINPEIIGSLEISVAKLGAKLIVVKGHSNCGAVALALKNVISGNMGAVTTKIQKAVHQCGCSAAEITAADEPTLEKVTRQNVTNSIQEILANSSYISEKVTSGEIAIVGAYHDLATGKVYFES